MNYKKVVYSQGLLLVGLLLSPYLYAQQNCSDVALATLTSGVRAELTTSVGQIEASACKVLPDRSGILLASAIFADTEDTPLYEDEDEHDHHWMVMLIDTHKWQIVAKYKEFILQDATVDIEDDCIWLDTAPYIIAPGHRAFGVRLDIANSHNCGDSGQNIYLTLFSDKIVQSELQPLIQKLPMSYWSMREGVACGGSERAISENAKAILQVLPSVSHGLYDLKLLTHGQEEVVKNGNFYKGKATSYQTVLRFNGKQYSLDWNNIPAKNWYRRIKH